MDRNKVFIIEDDEPSLVSLKKLLIAAGFEADGITNPKVAAAKAIFFKPNIILLDLLMPGIGGLEICEMLNNDERTRSIPIIVISALGSPVDIKKAYELGVVDYLTKPYDYQDLLRRIRKFISYKEGRQDNA